MRLMELPIRTLFYLSLTLFCLYESIRLWLAVDAMWFSPLLTTFTYIFNLYVVVDFAELIIYGYLLD